MRQQFHLLKINPLVINRLQQRALNWHAACYIYGIPWHYRPGESKERTMSIHIIGGKKYDSSKSTVLACRNAHSDSGNYSGDSTLLLSPRGTLWVIQTSNGQDLYRRDCAYTVSAAEASDLIDGLTFDAAELAALEAAGVIAEG
jgi:hypothetical protein